MAEKSHSSATELQWLLSDIWFIQELSMNSVSISTAAAKPRTAANAKLLILLV